MDIEQIRQIKRVIIHGGTCPDGRASGMIVNDAFRRLQQPVSIEFVLHGTPEYEQLEPEPGMLFLDISVPPAKADRFLEAGSFILDHHRGKEGSNKAIVDRFVQAGQGTFGDEDENPGVSGAVLAFDQVWLPVVNLRPVPHEGFELGVNQDLVRRFALIAGIRDTWQTSHELWLESCEQAEALRFWPEEELLNARPEEWASLMKLGQTLWAKHQRTNMKIARSVWHWTSKRGTRACLFQGVVKSSDVAELLDTVSPDVDLVIGYDYFHEAKGVKLQFSTRSHKQFDCAAFCGTFGGGGHTKAAGFGIPLVLEKHANPYKIAVQYLDRYEALPFWQNLLFTVRGWFAKPELYYNPDSPIANCGPLPDFTASPSVSTEDKPAP